MLKLFILAFMLTLIQLGGAYLRYLPFSPYLEKRERCVLWRGLLIWGALSLIFGFVLLWQSGFDTFLYKSLFILAPLPYILISAYFIREGFLAHIFVIGMQFLWVLALHTAVSICESFLTRTFADMDIVYWHPALYIFAFILTLPVSYRIFRGLFPSVGFFSRKTPNISIALLPLTIFAGFLLPIADEELLHSLKIQFSRVSIPIFFILIYSAISQSITQRVKRQRAEHTKKLMDEELVALTEKNRILRENRELAAKLTENMKEDCQKLLEYLKEENIESAIKLIDEKERILKTKKSASHITEHLVINAALSVHIERAKSLNMPVSSKISLPDELFIDEQDFALLISNLMENAINASKEEPKGNNAISVSISYDENCILTEITNQSSRPLTLDDEGLPVAKNNARGLGMTTLSSFMQKYNAKTEFTEENGIVRVLVSCENLAGNL